MNLLTVIHYKHTGHLWVLINVSTPCFMDDKGLNTLEQSLVETFSSIHALFGTSFHFKRAWDHCEVSLIQKPYFNKHYASFKLSLTH